MVTKKIGALYSLRKSKKVLRQIHRLYRQKAQVLDPHAKEKIESHLHGLQTAILQNQADIADQIAHGLQDAARKLMPRSIWDKTRDFILSMGFALLVAVLIRTMWFELYTIPTGSMRPTLKESDFLVVSKTDFGLNVPLQVSHFYFDPALVQRGSIFVFNGANMDIPDCDTMYFYLFPGKKQFVKRLIGKPGDTLYFYGGRIYGIDASGRDLSELRNSPWVQDLEHIPFIRFDGKVETPSLRNGLFDEAHFYQMNEQIAKLKAGPLGNCSGETISQQGRPPLNHYSDLWGFKNYAMSRLLNREQLEQIHPGAAKDLDKGILYLELTHHPSLKDAKMIRDEMNRLRPDLGTSVSLLPLREEHINKIANHLVTCRFTVEQGRAYRLGFDGKDPFYSRYFPLLSDVPDGTYEIQNGKAYKVYWGGFTQELPSDHPLYRKDPERVQLLYNLGIEFLSQYTPTKNGRATPSRYAYFRDGDLYLLGAPILKKSDPTLIFFLKREYQKQSLSTSVRPYIPFDDAGAPLSSDGTIDTDFIKKYGITVPAKMYLGLGDNHAMSADSRQFGFIPEDNIKGGVSFLFSPPGIRWGSLPQPAKLHLTFPNLFVLGAASLITVGYSLYVRRKTENPLSF